MDRYSLGGTAQTGKVIAGAAFAYCRVSTKKDEQEPSLDEQLAWARVFAREHCLDLTTFHEKTSAKSMAGRPQLALLLEQIKSSPAARRPKYVLLTAFDRLARDMMDAMMIAWTLRNNGIRFILRDRGLVRMESFADIAAMTGELMGGHAENEGKSIRMKASWDSRRRDGKPTSNKVPYGMQMKNGWDTAVPDSGSYVRLAFELYASGTGTHRIANRLRAEAPPHRVLTTRLDDNGNRVVRERQPVWESNRVGKMLRQPRYRGIIVDEALFDRVQQLLENKPKTRLVQTHEYPLSGAIRCAGCQRRFHGAAGGGAKRKRLVSGRVRTYDAATIRYYSCVVCNYRINANFLEQQFMSDIRRLSADRKLLERWINQEPLSLSDERETRKQITQIEKRLNPRVLDERRSRVWETLLEGPRHLAKDAERQLERIEESESADRGTLADLRKRLDQDATATRNIHLAKSLLAQFADLFRAAAYDVKRELVGSIINALGGATADKAGLHWTRQTIGPVADQARDASA